MSAERDYRITRNGNGSGHLSKITVRILNFKSNGMNPCCKYNEFACKIPAGSGYIFKCIAINIYFTCCIIQLHIIGNSGRKRHCIAAQYRAFLQGNRFIRDRITYVVNCGKHPVFYSRTIIQGDIVNIKRKNSRNPRLYICTDKGRRTYICIICCNRRAKIIVLCKINRCVHPS